MPVAADETPTLASLKARVAGGERELIAKFSDRLDAVENLRLWAVIGTVLGALVAALARLIDDPDWSLGITVGGAVMAAVSGGFTALMDRRKIDIGRDARDAHEWAGQAIALAEKSDTDFRKLKTGAEGFDRKRRERLTAIQQMLEIIEASLVTGRMDATQAAEEMLERSIQSIRSAIDFRGDEFFTVSIFRRTKRGDTEVMVPIAAQWTDPHLARQGGRSWPKGKGYTGIAWRNAVGNPNGDVIIADTTVDGIVDQYPVDHPDPEREALYRSVAAIPVLIHGKNEVWGVVTATSSRAGVFDRDKTNLVVQNVDVIRDIAHVAALLAGIGKPGTLEELLD